jgi:sugar phosphate permease
VLAPELQSQYRLSLEGVGVVLASVNLGVLATVLPWGILADRVGERAVIAAGLGSASAAAAAAAFADGVVTLSVALFAAGGLGACVQAASGRAVMGWFPTSQRGLALGIRQTGVPLGGAAAALALPVCLSLGGLRAALGALAAALLLAAAAGGRWLRDPERPPAPGGSERPPLADPRIWRLCWASGLLYVALGSLIGFAVLFLHSDRGVSTQVAAAMLAFVQVIGAGLRLLAGRWSDRAGSRLGPLRRLGFALAAASAVVAALVSAPLVVLVPAIVVAGSLSQSWNGLSFTAAAELAGYSRSGAALGLQQASLSLSSVVTPIGFAAIVAATSWGVGFGVAAAAALAGTLALRGLGEGQATAA